MRSFNRTLTFVSVLITMVLCVCISCQKTKDVKMELKIIDFNKIPGESAFNTYFDAINKYKFNQIITFTKDVFFLLGSDEPENPRNENAIIFSSLDFGETFVKTTLGPGSVIEGCFAGKSLFVVKEERAIKEGVNSITSTLFISPDLGLTWEDIASFDHSVSRINFFNTKVGIASFFKGIQNGDDAEYYYTLDGGRTWTTLHVNDRNFDSTTNCFYKSANEVWFVSNNKLMSCDLNDNTTKILRELPVPKGMIADVIDKDEKNGNPFCFISAEKDDKGLLYYILEDRLVELNNGFGIVHGDLLYKFNYSKPYSSFIWSYDFGKSWISEELDFFVDPSPLSFAADGYFYVIGTVFKGAEQGARLVIGHPVLE